MAREPMETIRAVHVVMMSASKAGLDPETLLRTAGLSILQVQDLEARVPARTVMELWDEAVRLTGRDDLGLSVGQWYMRDPGDVLSGLFFNSMTLGEGITAVHSYYQLVSEGHYPSIEKSRGYTYIKLITHSSLPQGHKPTAEAILSMIAKLYLSFVDGKPIFQEVKFRHGHTGDSGTYREHFKAPVHFGQDCNALVLKPGVWEMPNPSADSAMVEVLERYASGKVASLEPDDRFLEDARTLTAALLRGEGFSGKEQVARKLGVSPRTLHRRLAQSGTTFQELLESVRREVTLACLENPGFSIQDAAFMAGYGGQQAFSRAFVRWFGVPPAQYRRGLITATGG